MYSDSRVTTRRRERSRRYFASARRPTVLRSSTKPFTRSRTRLTSSLILETAVTPSRSRARARRSAPASPRTSSCRSSDSRENGGSSVRLGAAMEPDDPGERLPLGSVPANRNGQRTENVKGRLLSRSAIVPAPDAVKPGRREKHTAKPPVAPPPDLVRGGQRVEDLQRQARDSIVRSRRGSPRASSPAIAPRPPRQSSCRAEGLRAIAPGRSIPRSCALHIHPRAPESVR